MFSRAFETFLILFFAAALQGAESPLAYCRDDRLTLLVHPDEFTGRWIDRAAKLGVDRLSVHPAGGSAAVTSLSNLLVRLETPDFRSRVDEARRQGLEVGYEMHAAGWLLPRSLFAEHPDWFRMDEKGTRRADCNFCVSSDAAMDFVARRAVELTSRLYGSVHDYSLWLDDCRGKWCRCAKCRGLSPGDQQLVYCNRVVAELRRHIPDARLSYLAYFDAMTPPTKVRPAPGVFLEYAPIDRDMRKPLIEQDNADVRPLADLLRTFGRPGSCALDYWVDNSFFSKWRKPPKRFVPETRVILADTDRYRRLGFETISSFACFLGDDYERLWGEPDLSAFVRPRRRLGCDGFHSTCGGRDSTRFWCGRVGETFVFRFDVVDDSISPADPAGGERAIDFSDRVELFFSATPELKGTYHCLEIDPEGRIMDYSARMYRQMDYEWRVRTLQVRTAVTPGGYVVVGNLSLRELAEWGVDPASFGLGVFRADFDKTRQLVSWCSAVPMPDVRQPDFHRPNMFFSAKLP